MNDTVKDSVGIVVEDRRRTCRVSVSLSQRQFDKLAEMAMRDRVPLSQEVFWATINWLETDGRAKEL